MKKIIVLFFVLASLASLAQDKEFTSSWHSLEKYKCPQWFRDAKFGIWTCWNAYTVPAMGDWYARNMYIEGSEHYKYHIERYGHPSKVGYKDIVQKWKGENFDPAELVALFKEAGAKYIVALAAHHDNVDNWDSKYHEWNTVNYGPKQNIIGKWEKAVRASGLRWGVTSHIERSWNWMQVAKGADKKGEYVGVPYDGTNPKFSGLYFKDYPGYEDTNYGFSIHPPQEVIEDYFFRIKDLLDQHNPDLFYFDGGIPFGETGRKVMAYFYNSNTAKHDGQNEAVMCIKNYGNRFTYHGDNLRNGVAIEDVERGQLSGISTAPWQTDDSIGDWFWKGGDHYNTPKYILDQLVDIVSKNGNLLLNVPPRADGTLDEEAIVLLKEIGEWMKVNGEGIYGTRPFHSFGEGPTLAEGGHFKRMAELGEKDIRFTTKGDIVYAFVCGSPTGEILLESFAGERYHKIKSVKMLGSIDKIRFVQETKVLRVHPPQKLPSKHIICLKIVPEMNKVPESLSEF